MSDWSRPLRTLLFVPGSEERKLNRVDDFGADAIAIDLEDAVAEDEKDGARLTTAARVATLSDRSVLCVRTNGLTTGRFEEDLRSTFSPKLDAYIVPKVETVDELRYVDAAMTEQERQAGVPVGSVRLLALIETARGIAQVQRFYEQDLPARLLTFILGSGDLSEDLDLRYSGTSAELVYPRSVLVNAANAARLIRPLDGPFLRIHDAEGLDRDTTQSLALGMQGRVTVYPPQVETINRVYAAATMPIELARLIVERFDAAEAEGVASIQVEGLFVDYPIYRQALEVVRTDRGAH